jgi:hypothetical protein
VKAAARLESVKEVTGLKIYLEGAGTAIEGRNVTQRRV